LFCAYFMRSTDVTAKAKILIVEDDAPVAMMIAHALTLAGCDVQGAHTGEKAMRLAREDIFDLITLDIDLPDMSGFDVCRQLKQLHQTRTVPIVFISGRPLEEDRWRGLEVGAVDFIAKPFGVEFVSRLLSHIKPAPAYA
jgi:DNA-binding response OmpR family regulator